MKKTLIFLLLVCVSLFTLTGCGKGVSTKKAATEDEFDDFIEDKLDAFQELLEDDFSMEIKYSFSNESKTGSNSLKEKTKVEGRMIFDGNKPEKSSFYYKITATASSVEYGKEGKVKGSEKYKEECTLTDETLYRSVETSSKLGESKWSESYKEKTDVEDNVSVALMGFLSQFGVNDFLSFFTGNQKYIDGDKCLLITSTPANHIEVTLTFNGDDLVSIECNEKSYGYESELKIEFKDVKSISKPKDASKYKKADE